MVKPLTSNQIIWVRLPSSAPHIGKIMKESARKFVKTVFNMLLVVIGGVFLLPVITITPFVLLSVYCASLSFRCVKAIKD